MKKVFFIYFLFIQITVYCQDSINDKQIYLKQTFTNSGSCIDFHIGVIGKLQSMGKRGKKLLDVIKTDSEAVKEFNMAYKCARKKRLFNVLGAISVFVGVGSVVPLALGADDDLNPINAVSISGGIGVVVGWGSFYYCHYKSGKYADEFDIKIKKSVSIYNNNLKNKK